MQRRAAAIYFVFFVVVGAAAYAYIGVAQETQQPQISLDAEATIQQGGAATIDGRQYEVTELGHAEAEGGHGGGGEGALQATLAWTNESSQFTETLAHNSTIRNASYRVLIANESDVNSFTLREEQNVSTILRDDPAVTNELAVYNDTRYVVYRENGTLQPLEEYLPQPATEEYAVGDTFEYAGNQTTVAEVMPEAATITWTGPERRTEQLSEGDNVTLGGQQYFVHFPDENTVQLVPASEYGEYDRQLEQQEYFHERMNGLWGVAIVSLVAAVLLLSAAYLPVKE